jgi:predicted nuclease of predicted toxin-antitoxin system
MRFLCDMGVSMSTARALRERGHDVVHLREEGLHKLPDEDIVEKARQEGRIILTFDLDFGDLLAAGLHRSPSVILFRLHNQTPPVVTRRLLDLLSERGRDIEEGALIVVEDMRHRVRRLPILDLGGGL